MYINEKTQTKLRKRVSSLSHDHGKKFQSFVGLSTITRKTLCVSHFKNHGFGWFSENIEEIREFTA